MCLTFKSTIFVIFCLCSITACEQTQVLEQQRLRSVKYQQISTNNLGSIRTFSGLAKGAQEANLSFKIAGTIESLPVKVGDQLKAGQLIAQLDASQYELQVQQAQASLAQATAALRNASAAFERLKGLYENNNASLNELDAARASSDSNKAQVRAADKSLELTRLNLTYTRLKSTKDCGIAEVNVENNENVSSGQSIVKVSCGKQIDVEIAVPGLYVASIKKDMSTEVTFSTMPGVVLAARVSEVGVASSSGGVTFPVTVSLEQPPENLRSGMVAEVSFSFNQHSNTESNIVISAIAVSEDSLGRFVYLLQPATEKNQGIIKRRAVVVGTLTAQGLEISEGLQVGDKVITAGITVIRDGLKVRVN